LRRWFKQAGPPVLGNDGLLRRGVRLSVNLLLPGLSRIPKRVVEHIHRAFGDTVYLSLMSQYTPVVPGRRASREINRTVRTNRIRRAGGLRRVSLALSNCYVQEGGAALGKASFRNSIHGALRVPAPTRLTTSRHTSNAASGLPNARAARPCPLASWSPATARCDTASPPSGWPSPPRRVPTGSRCWRPPVRVLG